MSERFVWRGPVGDRGGYGNVARNFLHGLAERGAEVAISTPDPPHAEIGERELSFLATLPTDIRGDETFVFHGDPSQIGDVLPRLREVFPGRIAACTIAETDRLPKEWAAACNLADEVWVPSTFNLLTFARSGVSLEKLRLVPYGIDGDSWAPHGPVSADVASPDHFCFLYTFAFDWRKGFDILLAAYLSEFTRRDPVSLILKVYDPRPDLGRNPRAEIAAAVTPFVDLFREDLPRVVILDRPIDRDGLAALYRRADLYVSTDRANGWGMPCMETMAIGKAAATIDWSGSTEFMHADNALLIPAGELGPVDRRLSGERPDYAGQRWPEVSVDAVREVLRAAASGAVDLAELGRRARDDISTLWTAWRAGGHVLERDSDPYRPAPGLLERLRPAVGLAAQSPFADARENVFVAAFDRAGSWRAAMDAYLEAFRPDSDATLVLWGTEPQGESDLGCAVIDHLKERGVDPAEAPDLMVCVTDPEEVLVEPRVRAIVEPASFWPSGRLRVAAEAHALRAAAAGPRPVHA
jgi:glycosyltransferase involved in cell wall biosynthesis